MAKRLNIEMARGERIRFLLDEQHPPGTPISLAGRTYYGTIRLGPHSTGEPLATWTCALVDHPLTEEPESAVEVVLEPEDSAGFPAAVSELSHDIWVTHTDGTPECKRIGIITLFPTPSHVEVED